MSGILAFASYKNKYPNSFFEKVGDALLTPIPTLCARNSFVVLKNERTNNRCIYTYTNNSKSSCRMAAEVVASIVTLPIALVGLGIKGLSLVFSPETRDIYTHWQTPLQPQYNRPNEVLYNFFRDYRKSGYYHRSINIKNLTEFAVRKGCAPQLLQEFIQHPREYLVATRDGFMGDNVHLLPDLNECACVRTGYFNRLKNQRRVDLENQLVRDATTSFPPSKNFRLNYVGFGAGRLLQEFMNVGKLMEAGYQDLNIVLIDPSIRKESTDITSGKRGPNPSLEQFKFLLDVAKQKGIRLQIQAFENITEYRRAFPNERAHCISAIDFDEFQEAFDDVTLCHQILHEKGKFYLSYNVHDFCFSAAKCVRNKLYGKQDPLSISIFGNLQKDVRLLSQKLLQNGQRVARYAKMGTAFNFEEWTCLLPQLAKSGCDKIEFTLIHPPNMSNSGGPNPQFTKRNLEYFLKLFLPEKTRIEVRLVESIDAFKRYLKQSQTKFDMITWLDLQTNDDQQTAKENIRWVRQNAVAGNIYYGLAVNKRKTEKEPASLIELFWRWNADLGINYLLPPKPEYQTVIDELMKGKQAVRPTDSRTSIEGKKGITPTILRSAKTTTRFT